jgi:ribonucrease Y
MGPSAADQVLRQARLAAEALVRGADLAAREVALARRAEIEQEARQQLAELARKGAEVAARERALQLGLAQLETARERLRARERPLAQQEAEGRRQTGAAESALAEVRRSLERISGARAEALRGALAAAEVEVAAGEAAHLVRQAELEAPSEVARRAARVLGTAVNRLSLHNFTERSQPLVSLGQPRDGQAAVSPGELQAIEAVTGVKLAMGEGGDVVRLDGLDGVAREVARRTLLRLLAGTAGGGGTAVTRAAREVQEAVDAEVLASGERAFAILEIERAHPEITRLVGRLNWRTSHTQNQWKHAMEAAFLCGLMAEELGLSRALARRAALLHDIGKALSHEVEGAHAVIGADLARRLGEVELVANAIGAHHTDEPFASPYAHLVAAADALSGGRPGARRHTEDHYVAKIADLERISRDFPGVAEAFAVQGGREVRVLVREEEVDDAGAVALSSSIAQAIANRLTFPGQIRVTVIRELKAVARTGA